MSGRFGNESHELEHQTRIDLVLTSNQAQKQVWREERGADADDDNPVATFDALKDLTQATVSILSMDQKVELMAIISSAGC